MEIDPTLKAQFDLLDDDGLVAHRDRPDLIPEAYAALDAVLAERNIGADRIEEIRAAAEDPIPDAESVRYADRTFRTMRAWFFVIMLWWPVVFLLHYAFKPLEVVMLGLFGAWLIAILIYASYLARTAKALGKSAVAWVGIALFFTWVGWIIAWAVMSRALRNMKARANDAPSARNVLNQVKG